LALEREIFGYKVKIRFAHARQNIDETDLDRFLDALDQVIPV
jgi:hypothetical protein